MGVPQARERISSSAVVSMLLRDVSSTFLTWPEGALRFLATVATRTDEPCFAHRLSFEYRSFQRHSFLIFNAFGHDATQFQTNRFGRAIRDLHKSLSPLSQLRRLSMIPCRSIEANNRYKPKLISGLLPSLTPSEKQEDGRKGVPCHPIRVGQ